MPLELSVETTRTEDSTMRDVLEIFAAPVFAIIDFALAAPIAAVIATGSVLGVVAMLVAIR